MMPRLPAPGGLPFDSQGTAIGLLSAGIDSPVCVLADDEAWVPDGPPEHGRGYLGRGCHFRRGDRKITGDFPSGSGDTPLRMLVVHSAPFYDALSRGVPRRYTCILCKRFHVQGRGPG